MTTNEFLPAPDPADAYLNTVRARLMARKAMTAVAVVEKTDHIRLPDEHVERCAHIAEKEL